MPAVFLDVECNLVEIAEVNDRLLLAGGHIDCSRRHQTYPGIAVVRLDHPVWFPACLALWAWANAHFVFPAIASRTEWHR
jgi:hypothetical protein